MVITILTGSLKAQFLETDGFMSKGKHKGIQLQMDTLDKNTAFGAVNKTIAEKDHSVTSSIISFDELFFDNAKIPSISDIPFDLYAKFHDSDNSLTLFIDQGTAFIDPVGYPKEFSAFQHLCLDIRKQVWNMNLQNDIDSLKRRLKQTDDSLAWVTTELKSAENSIKDNNKGAAKDEQTVVESQLKLSDANAQIRAIDSFKMVKEKEFSAFPLEHLKTINASKNKALDKNRSTRKKLINKNTKSRENIAEYETEIALNNSAKTILKDNENEARKLNKANQKLNSNISKEQLNITLNDASISTLNGIIKADSLVVKKNQDSLDRFDEEARRKELKQLENKKKKLVEKGQKSQTTIDQNRLESDQKKLEAEKGSIRVKELTATQDRLKLKQVNTKTELSGLETRKGQPAKDEH